MLIRSRVRAHLSRGTTRRVLTTVVAVTTVIGSVALLQAPAAQAAGGAAYTSTNPTTDGAANLCDNGNGPQPVNCNIYTSKSWVWLNGGPDVAFQGAGNYFFAVLAPGGQGDPVDLIGGNPNPDLLSSDAYTNRVYSVDGSGSLTYSGTHDFDHASSTLGQIRLMPYADTPNPGGVYIMALCSLGSETSLPASFDYKKSCKYDAFKVKVATPVGAPTGVKTVNPSHEESVDWEVSKVIDDGSPTGTHSVSKDITAPDTESYDIVATKTVSGETFGLAGVLTVTNPNPKAMTVDVSENGLLPAVTGSSCAFTGSTSGKVGADGGTLDFPYTCTFGGDRPDLANVYVNSATISYVDPDTGADQTVDVVSDPFQFPAPMLTAGSDPQSVTVDDPNAPAAPGFPVTVSDTTTFPAYQDTYPVPNGCADHANTAQLLVDGVALLHGQTPVEDSTNVHVCGPIDAPTGTKSATATHTEVVHWSIVKTVDNGGTPTHDLNLGDVTRPQTVNYTVTATKTISDETFGLAGTLTVSNTNPDALDVTVTDTGLTPGVDGSSCTLAAPGGKVPAATANGPGLLPIDYTCSFPGDRPVVGTSYTNTATVTYADPNFATTPVSVESGPIVFPAATAPAGVASDAQTVTVSDPLAPVSAGFPKTISDSASFAFHQTYSDLGCLSPDNTATFAAGATGSDTATVHYCLTPPPVVPLVAPGVTCTTDVTSLSLPVEVSTGATKSKAVRDVVVLNGLPSEATTKVTASLYGPSATKGVRGDSLVATLSFLAGNGKTLTDPVTVYQPGYYTWEVSTPSGSPRLQSPVSRLCSDSSQTLLVHRSGFGRVKLPTGFSGPVAGAADRAAQPSVLSIPPLGVHARIATSSMKHGQMRVPSPWEVGWLTRSAAVDEVIGTTVIAGHVSDQHDRPGALYNLHRIRRGQLIEISGPKGVIRFKVTSVRAYRRNRPLPKSLFSTTGAHRLALVTCTGEVVHGGFFHYTRNLVVIARPIA